MEVLNIVNSFVGKRGNIGFRTGHILEKLSIAGIPSTLLSRGCVGNYPGTSVFTMGIFGHIPRILNAYRMYVDINYNHRKHDIWLFEQFYRRVIKKIKRPHGKAVAHLWENSPAILRDLKKRGYFVVLDVPIAPTRYSQNLIRKLGPRINLQPFEENALLEEESYNLADYIVAPSIFVKRELLRLNVSKDKVFVVPFGAEPIQAVVGNSKRGKKEGVDFCFAGTVNARKGIDYLLEAWNDKRFEKDRLHLCGRVYPQIETLLKKYSFKNVITPGFVNPGHYFQNCYVYVFPSLLEGSSKSIYEAMSASMPCITTFSSGSIIDNGVDGFIVDIADVNALKEKMLYFKKNPAKIREMGDAAKDKVKTFTWSVYANRVHHIYSEVAKI